MTEPKYDQFGGIVNLNSQKNSEQPAAVKTKKRYNFLEKLLIRWSPRINYLLDKDGRYVFHDEKKPTLLRIGFTNLCTARCVYCPREYVHGWGTGYMDFDFYKKIIDWAAENQVGVVSLGLWGELTLHPRLLDIFRYTISRGLKIRFSSNAITLNASLADQILTLPFDSVEFSLDGCTREEYMKGKGVDKYEIAKKNIIYFLDKAKELKSDATFNIHFVDAGNVSLIDKIKYIRFWAKELKGLKFQTNFYYEPHNWAGARSGLEKNLGFLSRMAMKWKLKKPCPYLKGMIINWDGTVHVCANNPIRTASIGNIKKASIEEIYSSAERIKYLQANETGDFSGVECGRCTVNCTFPLSYMKKIFLNTVVKIFS